MRKWKGGDPHPEVGTKVVFNYEEVDWLGFIAGYAQSHSSGIGVTFTYFGGRDEETGFGHTGSGQHFNHIGGDLGHYSNPEHTSWHVELCDLKVFHGDLVDEKLYINHYE